VRERKRERERDVWYRRGEEGNDQQRLHVRETGFEGGDPFDPRVLTGGDETQFV